MLHNNSGPNCTRQWCIRRKRNWKRKMENKLCCLHHGKGKCCWGWKEENNMPVQQQLIWNTAANHWDSQHFTLIFCLSNNLLQNSAIDLQSTWSFRTKIRSWLHQRRWLDTDDEKPDGYNHLQPGGRRIEDFQKESEFPPQRRFSLLCSISNKLLWGFWMRPQIRIVYTCHGTCSLDTANRSVLIMCLTSWVKDTWTLASGRHVTVDLLISCKWLKVIVYQIPSWYSRATK